MKVATKDSYHSWQKNDWAIGAPFMSDEKDIYNVFEYYNKLIHEK